MKAKDLQEMGIPRGGCMQAAFACIKQASDANLSGKDICTKIKSVISDATSYVEDKIFGELARAMLDTTMLPPEFIEREAPAPYRSWGDEIEMMAIKQMENAVALPVAMRGALMPDAHMGYGLPIGGVLATEGAVIPYAVGMDIACRMKLSVIDTPISALESDTDRFRKSLEKETSFGVGAKFKARREHAVMDEDWNISPVTKQQHERALAQLGTSGSGNHFVEYGTLEVTSSDIGLECGRYLALLSHSGSRGTGAEIAKHYSQHAQNIHLELPHELMHLAWLDIDSELGIEYWKAMELMGRYAAANHELIHRHVINSLGAEVLLDIENHHNFAWKENHADENGVMREVIVHRKGATPAGVDAVGIIPGSMGTPGYVVRGRGEPTSLNSASHGAGRKMSRSKAMKAITWPEMKEFLKERNVELMSAGLDEAPMAYKDIDEVMAAQKDLVEPMARFDPRLVKMDSPRKRRRR